MAPNGRLRASMTTLIQGLWTKIPKLTRNQTLVISLSALVGWGFTKSGGSDSKGARWTIPIASVTGNQNVSGSQNHVYYAPPRFRNRSRVKSDGPDYPVLMASALGESNIVKAPRMIGLTLLALASGQGNKLDPYAAAESTLNQIALTDGTEVEELQVDLEQELKATPDAYRTSARIFVSYHTKVKIVNGKYRGHTGWVASKVIQRDTVEVTEP